MVDSFAFSFSFRKNLWISVSTTESKLLNVFVELNASSFFEIFGRSTPFEPNKILGASLVWFHCDFWVILWVVELLFNPPNPPKQIQNWFGIFTHLFDPCFERFFSSSHSVFLDTSASSGSISSFQLLWINLLLANHVFKADSSNFFRLKFCKQCSLSFKIHFFIFYCVPINPLTENNSQKMFTLNF